MPKSLLDRRTLLRGAGGAAVGLPILDAMLSLGGKLPGARAAAGDRRLVIIFTGEGFPMNEWRPIAGATPSDFKLSTLLSPLEPIKQQSLFIEGVHAMSSADPKQLAVGHPAGAQAILTGAYAGPGTHYGGSPDRKVGFSPYPSIDMLIARALGTATRFPSYYWGVAGGSPSPAVRPFVDVNQKGISVQNDPKAAFTQLFSDVPAGSGTDAVAAANKRRADSRKAVLDAVMGDMKALRCQLGADDRARLDRHLTHVSEIQKVVSVPPASSGKGCVTPVAPTLTDRTFANARAVTQTQMDLMAAALACDLTRVACLSISHSDSAGDAVYSWLGHTQDHHNISHLMGTDPRGKMVQIGKWHAEQVMYLVGKLQAVQEPNGTLWDNTVILWVAEHGDGWSHDSKRVPFMILGGAGSGYFKTGRSLKYAGGMANAHNRLLQHFLLYMGVPTTGVGPAEYNAGGPLPGITTA